MSFFFADINKLNQQLQCDEINLIKPKSTISAFIENLPFYRQNIVRKDFSQFPCLYELNTFPSEDTHLIFIGHLKNIEDMKLQFQDLSALEIPPWILAHFQTSDISMYPSFEIEFINLRNVLELKLSFKWHAYKNLCCSPLLQNNFLPLWKKYYISKLVFNAEVSVWCPTFTAN